jgi:hypothetical protein
MKKLGLSLATLTLAILYFTGFAAAQGQYATGSTGVDVSWPNCSARISKVAFGVVGVTNGSGFSTNPCLKTEAANFSNLSLYVNTGYPGASSTNAQAYMHSPRACDGTDLNCIAYDYGYNAGLYAYNAASAQGVKSATWWLDVETMNSWTSDAAQNQNSLLGEHDALIASGAATVGAYSTTAQWDTITGSWHNGWSSWGATTWNTAKQAAKYCTGHEFTGGPSLLMQYSGKLDQDVAC